MKRALKVIIKKSGIFSLIIKIADLLCGQMHSSTLTLNKAIQKLNTFSPDVHTSSYLTLARSVNNPVWDLDIIIPCYNVQKTIRKCLDSCLEQKTNYSVRIIVINDGSTDLTSTILDKYKGYSNMLIVSQKNKGHSGARNTGLDLSNSKYLMFVDSDDFLAPDAIEKLMSVAMKKDAALVEGGYAVVDRTGRIIQSIAGLSGKVNPEQLGALKGQPWAKVFKSDLFQNIQFPESYLYEDTINRMIVYDVLAQTNQEAYCISDCVYCYFSDNLENITHTSLYNPKCLDTFYITVSLFHDREKFGLKINQDFYEYILSQIRLNYDRTRFMPKDIQKAIFVATRDFYMSNFNGYHTGIKALWAIEKALKQGNFQLYKIAAVAARFT